MDSFFDLKLTCTQMCIIIVLVFFHPNSPSHRKVNGPGTPRPVNRPKVSLASSLAANGLPDSTDDKDPETEQESDKESRSVTSKETEIFSCLWLATNINFDNMLKMFS